MAAPIITSATLDKTTIKPGGSAVLTVVATDPDNRVITFGITATDGTGTSVPATATLTVGDPVTISVTCADPKVIITPAGGGKFSIAVSA